MMSFPPPRRCGPCFRLPKTLQDAVGQAVFVFGGVVLLWYELGHILSSYYLHLNGNGRLTSEEESEVMIQYVVAIYFAINIYGNYYKIVTTDTSKDRYMFMSSSLMPEGWRYCAECDLNLPPRSHHCKVCNVCILKRDHHCWFTGCCIGYFNHRYYIAMVTHIVAAALYCNIYNLEFVVTVKGHLTLWKFLSYLGPHFGLIFGYYGFYTFFITTMTTVGSVLFLIFTWLLYIQIEQLWYGQTKHERKKRIKKYNLGFLHTLRECLGTRWFLVFLFPWLPSPLPGSGTSFKLKSD
ncbi:hypothetical protein DPMN_153029 [Dreissena polymorpha]|uniref:Palmitoyltransferase n=2 Tax=Dreissena polymorpha TaxID=45954 RepID=A0A9D4FME5_DREPO|nr:hypothetical protein DPMN_153029 [Dreissena polymorpha]